MDRTIAQLKNECMRYGILLDLDRFLTKKELEEKYTKEHIPKGIKKYKKEDLINFLGDLFLQSFLYKSKGLLVRKKISNLGVCFNFKNLTQQQKDEIMNSSSWIAEEKINGCRLLLANFEDEGIAFFSRHISIENYLPIDYTNSILLKKNGLYFEPTSFINKIGMSFVLDCEVVAESNINTSIYRKSGGVQTGSELNATVALLQFDPITSKRIQVEQSGLKLVCFDVLFFNGHDVMKQPLSNRIKLRDKIIASLKQHIDIEVVSSVNECKEKFYQNIISSGGEGVVFKNLSKTYHNITARKKDVWVKRKRSMEESHGKDIDVFISGFSESDPERGHADFIGGIKVSIFLKDSSGFKTEHHVGTISGLTMDLRRRMTVRDENGKPKLNPEWLDKVIVINGQSVSPQSKRFSHCTLAHPTQFSRPDKTKFDCEIEEDFLLASII